MSNTAIDALISNTIQASVTSLSSQVIALSGMIDSLRATTEANFNAINNALSIGYKFTKQSITVPVAVSGNSYTDVDVAIGNTVLLLDLVVNIPCTVMFYENSAKVDPNPYTFIATTNELRDYGITTLADGTIVKNRRYSILTSYDSTGHQLMRVTNTSGAAITVNVNMTYLSLE